MKLYSNILIFSLLIVLFSSCKQDAVEDASKTDLKINKNVSYNVTDSDLNSDSKTTLFTELQLSPIDYVQWVNNQQGNFLYKTKEIEQYNYSVKHLPIAYMICNELKKANVSQQEVDSLYSDYAGMEYYELKISIDDFNDETAKYGLNDMGIYQQRIMYMSFAMQNDLTATINKEKEVDCRLYHFERTYGVAPYAKFLFGFSKEEMGDSVVERTIVFEDNLFNKGLIKFNWPSSQLNNVPKIQVYDKEA